MSSTNDKSKMDRAPHYCAMDHEPVRHWCDTDPEELSCPVCSVLAELEQLKRENAALRAYKNLAEGLDKLCASYRTGRTPSEATFDKIAKARAALSPQEAARG